MGSSTYIACTRMYNICERAAALWDTLITETARVSGVPLRIERHSFPLDIQDLWDNHAMGFAFICGRAFVLEGMRHIPVAAPLRLGRDGGVPAARYNTVILVRDDSRLQGAEDLLTARIGWTVSHSHSGYLAVKRLLTEVAGEDVSYLFTEETGPLHTPINCLKALRDGTVDAAPLDGYCHELLQQNGPELLAGTRVLAGTREYPMPFLAASPQVGDEICDRLRQGLFTAASLPEMAPVLANLRLAGFVRPDIPEYAQLVESEEIPALI